MPVAILRTRWWLAAIAGCLLALCVQQVAGQGRAVPLWTARFNYLPPGAPETRARVAIKPTLNKLTLLTPALRLELPDATTLVAVRERAWSIGKDGVYWKGRIGKAGSATFTSLKGVLVGRFAAPDGRRYRLQSSPRSGDVLEEIDWRYFEVNHGPGVAALIEGGPVPTDLTCSSDPGDVIDVLVVWADASMPADPTLAEAWTRTAERETNDALIESGVRNVTISVVHIGHVAYNVASNAMPGTVLDELMQGSTGSLQQVRQMRDDHGADVVVLVAQVPSLTHFSGLTAFTFQDSDLGDSKGLANKAFSLISPWSLTVERAFFFAHELGHVMGAQHEDSSGDPFGHSQEHVSAPGQGCQLGLRTLGVSGCTTSCAPCLTTCPTFGAWSNTMAHNLQATQCNQPMGLAGVEDNALTIQKTAKTIANIRCSKPSQ